MSVALMVNGRPEWYGNIGSILDQPNHDHVWLQQSRQLEPEVERQMRAAIQSSGTALVYGYEQAPTSAVQWQFQVDDVKTGPTRIGPPDASAPHFSRYDVEQGGCRNDPNDYKYVTWLRVTSITRVGPFGLHRFEDYFSRRQIGNARGWAHKLVLVPEELPGADTEEMPTTQEAIGMAVDFERQLREYLAVHPEKLETGLKLYPGGREYTVQSASGRVDLLCQSAGGDFVVVELKAGLVSRDAVGQILSYIGAVRQEIAAGKTVRGIIVGHDFDAGAALAAAELPSLSLVRYDVRFDFHNV